MKRAVICVDNPQDYIDQFDNYSLMIVNPDSSDARKKYLFDQADWSVKITKDSVEHRAGGDYADEKLLWYTSGTVGDSKFYSFSQAQLDRLTHAIVRDLNITANDRYVGVMGLWHAHGQSLYWATRRAGCETHFLSVSEIRKLSSLQPTFVSAIPDLLKVMHNLPLTELRFLRSGSAPLKKDLAQALEQKFKVPVVEYFGMTEAMSHVLTNPLQGPRRLGTVGTPTTGVEARIENGHLWIRSDHAYTAEWFDTQDLAEQDEAGYYRITGRACDQINVRGYKFNPVAIEQQLADLVPELESVAIFGADSVNCVYTGTASVSKVIHALRRIHVFCHPKHIEKLDQIPKPNSGKQSRKWLIEHFNCK
jgi:acyl-coenzyme A synthetase/AMP-(fatty) acid ligase